MKKIPHVRDVHESNKVYRQSMAKDELFVVVEKEGAEWRVHADTLTMQPGTGESPEMASRCGDLYPAVDLLRSYLHAEGHGSASTANSLSGGGSGWCIRGFRDEGTASTVAHALRAALLGDRTELDALVDSRRPAWDDGTLNRWEVFAMVRRCPTCKAGPGVRCNAPRKEAQARTQQRLGGIEPGSEGSVIRMHSSRMPIG